MVSIAQKIMEFAKIKNWDAVEQEFKKAKLAVEELKLTMQTYIRSREGK